MAYYASQEKINKYQTTTQETCWENEKSLTIQMQIKVFQLWGQKKKKNTQGDFFLESSMRERNSLSDTIKAQK